jgi:hypothetical protein
MRAITATVTPTQPSALIRMDNYATAVLGGQVVVSGGAAYQLQHSYDDPCDLVNPVPVGSMFWDQSLLPSEMKGATATESGTFQIMACPLWFQLELEAAATSSVWSASDAAANGMALSNGGLTVTPSSVSDWRPIRSSVGKTTGKLYIEFRNSVIFGGYFTIGIANASFNVTLGDLGLSNYSCGMVTNFGVAQVSAGFTSNYTLPTVIPATNDVWSIAVDFVAGNLWIAQNNVWVGSGNPATGSLPPFSFVLATVGELFPSLSVYASNGSVWTLQSTAASQAYAPPSGFSAWDSGTVVAAQNTLTGAVRLTLLQVGEHSHSNITQGPFAPRGTVDDGVLEGSNFRAMGK